MGKMEIWSVLILNEAMSFCLQSPGRSCTRLSLVDGDPVRRGEPLVALDVVDAVLQVAVAFRQIDLQQVPQQVLQVGAEVGGESHLRGRANAYVGF